MNAVTPITGLNDSVVKKNSPITDAGRLPTQGSTGVSRKEQTEESFRTVFEGLYRNEAESMDSIFEEAASRYDISVDLLKAVAKTESNFNANAVSKAGAMGVMQLMPSTARSLGVTDPFDARQNIMGGAKCLKNNLDQFGGNVSLALAAYNAGAGSVRKYGGIPPYKETQGFVRKVLGYMDGSPLYAGKMVYGSQSLGLFGSSNSSSGNSSYGSVSDLLMGLYTSSYGNGKSSGLSAVSIEDLENQASSLLSGEGTSSSLWAGLYGGSSTNFLSGLYGGNSTNLMSGVLGGSSNSLLSSLYGGSGANLLSQGGSSGLWQGISGSVEDTMGMLLNAATDGSLDEEEYAGMVQVLRMQMMMNASRKLGSV